MAMPARPSLMTAAAIAILALAGFAALLPLIKLPNGWVVGWLLLAAGVAEMVAGAARHSDGRLTAMIAGAVTTAAGLLFVTDSVVGLYPVSYVVMGWLFVRAAVLIASGFHPGTRLKPCAFFSGFADLMLGLVLLLGLPVAALAFNLFGATTELVASFAVLLAVSFLITGISVLSLAAAERQLARRTVVL